MEKFETIRYDVEDHLATITLARPDKRNAMNQAMFLELGEAAELASSDTDVRGVLLVGEGQSFCAGIDLALLAELGAMGAGSTEFGMFIQMAQRPFRLLATMGKPTIAVVQGHALGAGFQLALACDLRVASPDARFAILELRYGIIPDLGGSHHLARTAGPAVAKELVWAARTIDAAEAFGLGIVNRLVDDDRRMEEAKNLMRKVTSHSPIAVSQAKTLINSAPETPIESQFEREALAQAACLQSEDYREAVAAFMEQRAPQFKGR
ncbi:MAG: enoyl-CoA hydratase/isomerase family protein [Actinomycetota bacterium]|nr:enoyl-CoA hydratase/isomerase family protein [Actinomycetota bacterium]